MSNQIATQKSTINTFSIILFIFLSFFIIALLNKDNWNHNVLINCRKRGRIILQIKFDAIEALSEYIEEHNISIQYLYVEIYRSFSNFDSMVISRKVRYWHADTLTIILTTTYYVYWSSRNLKNLQINIYMNSNILINFVTLFVTI